MIQDDSICTGENNDATQKVTSPAYLKRILRRMICILTATWASISVDENILIK